MLRHGSLHGRNDPDEDILQVDDLLANCLQNVHRAAAEVPLVKPPSTRLGRMSRRSSAGRRPCDHPAAIPRSMRQGQFVPWGETDGGRRVRFRRIGKDADIGPRRGFCANDCESLGRNSLAPRAHRSSRVAFHSKRKERSAYTVHFALLSADVDMRAGRKKRAGDNPPEALGSSSSSAMACPWALTVTETGKGVHAPERQEAS